MMLNPKDKTEARRMIVTRNLDNEKYGASDGRVTEINFLLSIIDDLPEGKTITPKRPTRRRNETCSVHYIDENGYKKRRGFATNEGLQGFLDKADARGYCVIAYA